MFARSLLVSIVGGAVLIAPGAGAVTVIGKLSILFQRNQYGVPKGFNSITVQPIVIIAMIDPH